MEETSGKPRVKVTKDRVRAIRLAYHRLLSLQTGLSQGESHHTGLSQGKSHQTHLSQGVEIG